MLELNITQQRNICKRFPSFELCYEERIHKKVCGRNELYMAIHSVKSILCGLPILKI